MCGIAGFIRKEPPGLHMASVIQEMTDTMTHRGPDDRGYALLDYSGGTPSIAFGHRRLKIIDLSRGAHQPMFNASKDLCITYNGEIYNYLEIKDELAKKGCTFVSSSDTEVILKAYEKWGTDCFSRFNGMWALAIFDKPKHQVILSRDRFGKKPLYYYQGEDEFVFASEIKALLKHPHVPKLPNYEKIFRYIALNYRYVDIDDSSFFAGIQQVPKSSYAIIDESLKISVHTYWRLDLNLMRQDISDQQAVDTFRDLLIDAVSIRLRSDVPVGCMLSGGMDSTSITSIAYKVLQTPITTFSGVTGEEKGVYDESEYIDSVVRETNADFHYVKPDPADIFETVDRMLYFHDEPICTVTWYSLFLLAEKIGKEGVPVILNGHAGDELLAGYWDHYHYHFYDLAQSGDLKVRAYEIEQWQANHHRNVAELDIRRRYIDDCLNHKAKETERFPDYSYLFSDGFAGRGRSEIDLDANGHSLLQRRLYLEMLYETVPASLRPEDRNTMSQSIESRSPFLDYRLAEFCFSLPGKFKIRNGLGKWLLREAMTGILPEDVRTRKDKAGFIAPADEWFRTTNKKQLEALFDSDSFASREIFDVASVKAMFQEHLSGTKNHQMVLWQLINIELWARRFFD